MKNPRKPEQVAKQALAVSTVVNMNGRHRASSIIAIGSSGEPAITGEGGRSRLPALFFPKLAKRKDIKSVCRCGRVSFK